MILLLEIARGFAALWVFLYHIKHTFEHTLPFVYQLSSYGTLGVPMFFVISGYVISHSAESSLRKNKSPVTFLKNRFKRIYPTFWVSVVIVLVLPFVIESVSFIKTGNYQSPSSVLPNVNLSEWAALLGLYKVFWASSPNLQAEFTVVNAVYWTLAIEFQFYLVIFALLYCQQHYRLSILIVTGASIFVAVLPIPIKHQINYGLFIHYWPAFAVGIGLAYLKMQKIDFRFSLPHSIWVLLGLVSGLLIHRYIDSYSYHFGFALLFGLFLWCIADFEKILTVLNEKQGIGKWLIKPWLILGAMSYSVYLVHGKLYQLPEMFVRQIVSKHNPMYLFLTVIGTLLLCYPLYRCIETRFMSTKHKDLKANKTTSPI